MIPLVNLGIAVATFITNSYLNIGGRLKYGTNLAAVYVFLLVLVRNKVLVPFMFLPSIFLSQTPEHKNYINSARLRIQRNYPETCTFFTLTTKDNVNLDAVTFYHQDHVGMPMEQTKWLIWCNPNGAAFEEMLDFLQVYSREVGVSFLAFNYRGVARSAGSPQRGEDLVVDGTAAMDYLLSKGVLSKYILLHGHSMGGAVATKLRARYPDGPIISDRSFRSINHVVLSMVLKEPALGAITGGLVGAMLGGLVGGTVACSYPIAVASSFLGLFTSSTIGYKWGYVHSPIVQLAIKALGWSLNVEEDWKKIKGHKIVIYHELDGVIHSEASLFSALDVAEKKENTEHPHKEAKILKLEYEHTEELETPNLGMKYMEQYQALQVRHQIYHVYPLDTHKSDWEAIVNEARFGLMDQ